ncbi:methyltransferase domain-containing protein [Paenibacillus sp. KN14-4R]|uniref:methyltransferase domain-containing protein n=1 Tax=Paenibacillus sp. KN14-4R TaxID=3445773 RepID=UPI003FA17AAA
MTEDKTKRLTVYLPEKMKADLEQMAAETGLSMTQVIVMATHSILANYKTHGSAIFAHLTNARQQEAASFGAQLHAIKQETNQMQAYYGARANEYEAIYHREDPEFQAELTLVGEAMKRTLANRHVLEVACGTGYWTQIAMNTVKYIMGIDIRPEVLEIAKSKEMPASQVQFTLGDAYELSSISDSFDAGLANCWFSHIPKNKLDDFLQGFHRKLGSGAAVFMMDNVYVAGRGGELLVKENCEDTFKLRQLADGSQHEILKNYYTKEELLEIFKPYAKDLKVFVGNSFWYVSYTVA